MANLSDTMRYKGLCGPLASLHDLTGTRYLIIRSLYYVIKFCSVPAHEKALKASVRFYRFLEELVPHYLEAHILENFFKYYELKF